MRGLLFNRHSLLFKRSSLSLAATAATAATVDCLKRFSRDFKVYTLSDSMYKSPWDRPEPLRNTVVTHLDASPDKKGSTGGAIAWVTRDAKGDVLDQGSKWIPGVTDANQLECLGFVEFTSTKPRFGVHHIICNDNAGVVTRIRHASQGKKIGNVMMGKWAEIIWKQLQANFPADTIVKFVPRENNNLADAKARFARLEQLEKVAVCRY